MIVPLLATGAILALAYASRDPVTSVRMGHRYLLGFPQYGPNAEPSAEEIQAAQLFVQGAGFSDVTYVKRSDVNGRPYVWFKGTWSGEDRTFSPDTPVTAYEVLW